MIEQENDAARFAREVAVNAEKVFKATRLIANTRDEEVKVGTTPKHLVMRRDKVELFRYEPLNTRARRLRAGRPLYHGRSSAGSLPGA